MPVGGVVAPRCSSHLGRRMRRWTKPNWPLLQRRSLWWRRGSIPHAFRHCFVRRTLLRGSVPYRSFALLTLHCDPHATFFETGRVCDSSTSKSEPERSKSHTIHKRSQSSLSSPVSSTSSSSGRFSQSPPTNIRRKATASAFSNHGHAFFSPLPSCLFSVHFRLYLPSHPSANN